MKLFFAAFLASELIDETMYAKKRFDINSDSVKIR